MIDQEENKEMPEDRTGYILEAGEYFLQFFKPASCDANATNQLTTQEIYRAIKRLNPDTKVIDADIYQMMVDNGFIYKPDSNLFSFEYKWLLIRIA